MQTKKNPALLGRKVVKECYQNKLGAQLFRNLNVNVGPGHNQGAQNQNDYPTT
jgi:large subunit ribosomal protein L13